MFLLMGTPPPSRKIWKDDGDNGEQNRKPKKTWRVLFWKVGAISTKGRMIEIVIRGFDNTRRALLMFSRENDDIRDTFSREKGALPTTCRIEWIKKRWAGKKKTRRNWLFFGAKGTLRYDGRDDGRDDGKDNVVSDGRGRREGHFTWGIKKK